VLISPPPPGPQLSSKFDGGLSIAGTRY